MKPLPFLKDDAASAPRIPLRSEVALADTWDLTVLYPTPEDWDRGFAQLQEIFPGFARFKGTLGASADSLRAALEFDKELSLLIERLHHYASLKISEDSSDAVNLKREGQLQNLLTQSRRKPARFSLPRSRRSATAVLAGWLEDPALAEWKIALRKIRRMKPHTLSEPEERLLALGASAIHGHHETFSQLTNVDMKFGVHRR